MNKTLWLSCFCLLYIIGCGHDEPLAPDEEKAVSKAPSDGKSLHQAPDAEFIPPPMTPHPPFDGTGGTNTGDFGRHNPEQYKGGSQGGRRPEHPGNHDEEEEEEGPKGICGNGSKDVLPNEPRPCPYDLYGATTINGGPSTLVFLNAATGQGSDIAPILHNGNPLDNVSAIDFSPTGVLYAVGIESGANNLYTIDCLSGAATLIGHLGIVEIGGGTITDIDFTPQGELFGYNDRPTPNTDIVGTINIVTGLFTPLPNPTGLNDNGNGLGSYPFPTPIQLFQAGNNNLNQIDLLTGLASVVSSLTFPALVNEVNAMDANFFSNIMYVSVDDNGSGPNYVATINMTDGHISLLMASQSLAPLGLNALAFNQDYETCDDDATPLPPGAGCDNCHLIEINCADGIDNDFNGLIDCADPACLNQACNDRNGCTTNDICTTAKGSDIVTCIGVDEVCDDGDVCTIDSCTSTSPTAFICTFTLNTSGINCSESIDACILGRCEQVPGTAGTCSTVVGMPSCLEDFACVPELGDICIAECEIASDCDQFGAGLECGDITTPSVCVRPCETNADCIAPQICIEAQGLCGNFAIDCLEENLAVIPTEVCTCTLGEDDCCDPTIPGDCECSPDLQGPCLKIPHICGCLDANPCTADSCVPNTGICEYESLVGIKCSVGGGLCGSLGICEIIAGEPTCVETQSARCPAPSPPNNNCLETTCDIDTGGCGFTPINNGGTCNDSNACTMNTHCAAGICGGGTAVSCDDNNPCTADSCDKDEGCFNEVLIGVKCSVGGGLCGAVGICEIVSGTPTCIETQSSRCPAPLPSNNDCLETTCNAATGVCGFLNINSGGLCDDSNACTTAGTTTCTAGVCDGGTAVSCDDNNPCTADSCDKDEGCFNETLVGVTCSVGGGLCGAVGICEIASGNPTCVETQSSRCPVPPSTEQCLEASCDPATGACGFVDKPNGASCDDGNPCTHPDSCAAGVCEGIPFVGPCTSANLCLTDTICTGDVCGGGTAVSCDDENPCTEDLCDPDYGCLHSPLDGPSGPACTPIDPNTGLPYLGVCAQGYTVCNNGIPAVAPEVTCEPMVYPNEIPEDTIKTCFNHKDDNCDGFIDQADPSCPLVAFVTSVAHDGNFGGARGADPICQRSANLFLHQFPGTYIALLSDTSSPVSTILPPNRSWDLPDYTTRIANNLSDLFDGTIQHPINMDELGNSGVDYFVWTGTNSFGSNVTPNCVEWTTNFGNTDLGVVGESNQTDFNWVDTFSFTCDTPTNLYCFQIAP